MSMQDIAAATKDYPRFPDGRIDYSHERVCFVLNCVIICGKEMLLTKRGADVIAYPNTINGVSGFIDQTSLSIEDLAKQELTEELEASLEKISQLRISEPFIQIDDKINREWHVYAVLVKFSEKFEPQTNWENKSADWYALEEVKSMQLMHGFSETVEKALALE